MADSQRLWLVSIMIRGNNGKREVCYFHDSYKNINFLLRKKTPTPTTQQKFSFELNTDWPMTLFIPF
jgi:hypothetical protein